MLEEYTKFFHHVADHGAVNADDGGDDDDDGDDNGDDGCW